MPLRTGKSRAAISSNISKLRHEGYPERQAIAIAMRKAGIARKRRRNPSGKGLLKNPLVWVLGGGVVVWGGYMLWNRAQASSNPNAAQIAQMQAQLTQLQAQPNPDPATLALIDGLRASIRAAGGTPT